VNTIIDSLLHPLAREHPWLMLIDGLLHMLNEGNPEESLRKFMRFNIKPLINSLQSELWRELERASRGLRES
jgi:hypothetical protein